MISAEKKDSMKLSFERFLFSPVTCYVLPFLLLGGHLLRLALKGEITPSSGYYLIHYLYTYDHGFVGRGLVGEVISWFAETVTPEITQGVILLFSSLLMIAASLSIGKALTTLKNDRERFLTALFMIIFICLLPMSIDMYYKDLKLDKILWALTLFSVLLSGRKYAIWLVPVLCVIATLINPVFLFCSMILISVVLLQEFYSSGFSFKNGAVCAVSYISMIALGIIGAISTKATGISSPDEFINFYFSRYSEPISESTYNLFATEWLFDYFEPLDKVFELSYKIYFVQWGNGITTIFNFILVAGPAYILLAIFWKKVIKNENEKFQKFIYFLCGISPLVIIPPVVLSWEFSKYFYNNFIMQVCLVIFFIVKNQSAVIQAVNQVKEYCKNNILLSSAVVIYFVSYCMFYIPV